MLQCTLPWVAGIAYPANAKKADLIELVKINKPATKYVLEELMEAKGHEVLRLPPYHSELNPIELSWAYQKRYVQDNLTRSSGKCILENFKKNKFFQCLHSN